MTIVYQLTEAELREVHLRQVKIVLRRRVANVVLPWRWVWPKPRETWPTWGTLLRECSRLEGFLVANTERGQEVRYRLTKPTVDLPDERWIPRETAVLHDAKNPPPYKGSRPRPPFPPPPVPRRS